MINQDDRRKKLARTANVIMKTGFLKDIIRNDGKNVSVFFGIDTSTLKGLMELIQSSDGSVSNVVISTHDDTWLEVMSFEKRDTDANMVAVNPLSTSGELLSFIGQGRSIRFNGEGWHVVYEGRVPYPEIVSNE